MTTISKQIALLAICATAFVGCQQQAPQQQRPVGEYAMLTLTQSNKVINQSSSATIRGRQDIALYPEVSGNITRVLVKEGQEVKRGQVMFIIDQVPYVAAVNTAKSAVEMCKAQLGTAKLNYESKMELFKDKVVSEFDLATAKNNFMSAQAQLAQAEAQLTNAKNSLSDTEVKSPCDGVIGDLPYRVGAIVSAATPQPLTTVSDNSTMYVYYSITENELLALIRQYGSKAKAIEMFPPVKLQLSDGTMYDYDGAVSAISGVIDRSTGTVSVRADFENPNGVLMSGATGNVITPSVRENVVIIPRAATYEIQNKVFAFQNVNGVATSAEIAVSRVNGGTEYIVESGLKTGDVVVAEGVGLLREGTPIKAKVATAAPAQPATQESKSEDKE
ncbi:MAG: efflux RND transporter periplasmic adaptor subunit [Rikenellaceae bacterium]